VFMYDDIAYADENPTKGIVINKPNGTDVYHGVPKDYTGDDVNVPNFLAVLKGEKPTCTGNCSGKVLNSGPNDHVFINLVDHGADSLFAFPNDILSSDQLQTALNNLHDKKKYEKLVFYLESCESGSMFKDVLKPNINIYATTASDFDESSYGCYCDDDPDRDTCLGDLYSVNWMEDSDKENIETETLKQQFDIVVQLTNMSHVQQYGQLDINKLVVGEFQGKEKGTPEYSFTHFGSKSPVNSRDIPLFMLRRKIAKENDVVKRQTLTNKLHQLETRRAMYTEWIKTVAEKIAGVRAPELLNKRSHLKNTACHNNIAQYFHKNCVSFSKNPFALKYGYMLVNICEQGYNEMDVIKAFAQICPSKISEPIL